MAGNQTVLLRAHRGAVLPRHRHSREEEFIVLEGECRIGDLRLEAGDAHFSPAGSWHDDITTDTGVLVLRRARPDLEAARQELVAARDLLAGYRGESRPRLDLNLTLGYQGLEAGDELGRLVSPFYSDLGGMHTRLEVTYGFPLRNRLAGGLAQQSAAQERQALPPLRAQSSVRRPAACRRRRAAARARRARSPRQ